MLTQNIKGWTVEDLKALKQKELMKLYLTLPCPTMEEMEGEYKGNLLDTGSFQIIKRPMAFFAIDFNIFIGSWMGKGFKSISKNKGTGYNSYRRFGKILHVLPMDTCISSSIYDGKDVFELDYTVYHSQAGYVNMIDEVRKVNDDLYLGIGNWGYFEKQRKVPFFFALSGPKGPYAGIDKQHRARKRKYPKPIGTSV